ncbi:hypothetical protein ASG47_07280 [Devosia sp. Leaf420]|uniref:ATP-binding protein n=1 Tax=Devosia sp. Leaf420 TaxID=1736374 RepID=UPI00071325F9|nr:YhaN family protein [Devosia sp. Leaf420]KQT48165.1 hypothetical protein ASG47_07280 [Devosia sp. Leaf420]
MRLRRLDLTRYGKFTDRTIDFGPAPTSGADLHIIFGLNEAGKSTALSGYLDLLFGIEERSRYNFLHEYASMRVGGVLEADGLERSFLRTKQRSNSLFDADNQPVAEVALSAHLAGLSRDSYGHMFSLDDETLEDGGKAILESKGDLGKLLFTASAGLSGASETLQSLEVEADSIYRKHAQGTALAVLKKRLAELKAERDAIDTQGSKYESLEAERIEATEKYDQALAEHAVMVARREAILKLLRALPMLADHRRKAEILSTMPTLPTPPKTWTGSVAEMLVQEADIAARLAANTAELERLRDRLSDLVGDDLIITVSERINALGDRKARHVAAGLDLPARRSELKILDEAVAVNLAALGRTGHQDPRGLLIPAATMGVVRGLFEQRTSLSAAISSARDELALAAVALEAAKERVAEERAVPAASRARLEALRSKIAQSGLAQERRQTIKRLEDCTLEWQTSSMRLRPWTGDGESLASSAVPNKQQISSWRNSSADLRSRRTVLADQISSHDATIRELLGRREAFDANGKIPDDAEALRVRVARDTAWKAHRQDLLPQSADVFAETLREDDAVSAARSQNARALEERRATLASLAVAESSKASVKRELDAIDEEQGAIVRAMRQSTSLGRLSLDLVDPEHLLSAIEEIVVAREESLDAFTRAGAAKSSLTRVEGEIVQFRSDIIEALARVGLTADTSGSLEEVVALAETFLTRQAKLDAEHTEALRTLAEREEELAARKRAVDTAMRREEEWVEAITNALAATWLQRGLPAAAIGGVLDQLDLLAQALVDRDAMGLRIEKMEADQQLFRNEVVAIAEACAHPLDLDAPEQMAAALVRRLELAERARANRDGVSGDIEAAMIARDVLLAEEKAFISARTEVLRAFAADNLMQVAEQEELLKDRDRVRKDISDLEIRLTAELAVRSLDEAADTLDGLDEDAVLLEKVQLEQRLENSTDALKEHLVRQTRAIDKLDAIGSDSAVARLDAQRRTVVLEMEEAAARYVRLRLGILSASHALRTYRDQHRSAMMDKASQAFSLMTRGHYSGLATQPSKNGEVLIAIQKDGPSKVADALSKGARFQLYLALRLAGYYEFAQARAPVPFIADDIMETFDHVRSEEVFRLFGEMATVGQVIYLTHHRHLCEIAQAVVPEVRVHELA